MTDDKLLEAAATAAGAEIIGMRGANKLYGMPKHTDDGIEYAPWNAWEDDGDAFRLAVKRDLLIEGKYSCFMDVSEFISDPCAATRHAIVRSVAASPATSNYP